LRGGEPVKPRRVKGLRPGMRLDAAAERIVAVRLDELCAYMPTVADPEQVALLHDMRIAAKRLRYILELTDFCFGPYATKAAKRTKQLQDLIGEIHDCDVTLPRVTALQAQIAPDDPAKVGLDAIEGRLRDRRDALFADFLVLWRKLSREGFRARLEFAIGERPEPPRNHDDFTSASVGSDVQG
jgi:CHAD domain-containing protein